MSFDIEQKIIIDFLTELYAHFNKRLFKEVYESASFMRVHVLAINFKFPNRAFISFYAFINLIKSDLVTSS